MAMVAAGHAIALVPGVLTQSLRRDLTALALDDAPTRAIYAITRAEADPHPALDQLIDHLTAALADSRPAAGVAS